MVFRAKERGALVDPVYVNVALSVLDTPGVRVASGVPYQSGGVQDYPLPEALDVLDWDPLFTWMDWSDPHVNQRVQAARKYEILVPKRVDPSLILWP